MQSPHGWLTAALPDRDEGMNSIDHNSLAPSYALKTLLRSAGPLTSPWDGNRSRTQQEMDDSAGKTSCEYEFRTQLRLNYIYSPPDKCIEIRIK